MQKPISPITMQPFCDKLGIENTQVVEITEVPKELLEQSSYDYARENIMETIEKAKNALDDIIDIGKATEAPRAYEVIDKLMQTICKANEQLLDLDKKQKELEAKEEQPDSGGRVTNNTIFVGSTSELRKMIQDKRLKDIQIED